jgi:Bacterial Ig-like domain
MAHGSAVWPYTFQMPGILKRGTCVLVALIVGAVLAPPAMAGGTAVEIDNVAGQIYDVSADRILFKQSDDAFAIKDRATQAVTSIPLSNGRDPIGGFLAPHGAIFVTTKPANPFAHVDEWRDGSYMSLSDINGSTSLQVDGDWAEWSNGNTLTRMDLSTGAQTQVSTTAGNTGNDVGPNGDVAFWGFNHAVYRYRFPTTTELAANDSSHWQDYPVTDGINVVWREHPPCCGFHGGRLRGYGPSGEFTLANTERTGTEPFPPPDYQVAGGYLAFTRGEPGSTQVWLREPDGDEFALSDATHNNRVVALTASGEVAWENFDTAQGFTLSRPGQPAVDIDTPGGGNRGYSDFMAEIGGSWYLTGGGSLKRVSLDRAPSDGSETKIDSATQGTDTPSHAEFEFSAPTVTDATFECKLDDAAYQECESGQSYTDLPHGPHTFAVRAVEPGGHVDPDPATAAWVVESTPPAVTISNGPDDHQSDSTPTFGGTAGDADEDSAKVTLSVYSGEGLGGQIVRSIETTRSGNTWSATVTPPLDDGTYTVEAQQSDAAANLGTSGTRTFTVDTNPPVASMGISHSPAIRGEQVDFDSGGSNDHGAGSLVRFEWDLDGDGDFERDTGGVNHTTKTYDETGTVHVQIRVTDEAGNTATHAEDLTVAPPPPPGLIGISINHGDRYANDRHVVVNPVWHRGETEIILSNDGGFQNAQTKPLHFNVPWLLEPAGELERLPKTVYARFDPDGTIYQDDIVLDETAPTLLVAEITDVGPAVSAASVEHTYRIRIKGRDRTSGINKMQVTTKRRHPGRKRAYKHRIEFKAKTTKIYVRLRDRAGNWSHWKRAGS